MENALFWKWSMSVVGIYTVFVQKNERHAISHSRISLNHSSELRPFVLYMFECKTNENRRSHLEILVSWQSSILAFNGMYSVQSDYTSTYVRPIISCIYYSNGFEKLFAIKLHRTHIERNPVRLAFSISFAVAHFTFYFGLHDFLNSMLAFFFAWAHQNVHIFSFCLTEKHKSGLKCIFTLKWVLFVCKTLTWTFQDWWQIGENKLSILGNFCQSFKCFEFVSFVL